MGGGSCFLDKLRRQPVVVDFDKFPDIAISVFVVVAHPGGQFVKAHILAKIAGIIAVYHNGGRVKMCIRDRCYRITLENGSYGVETYIDADSKIQITFEDGNTLIGYIECVEYGTYSDENDTLVIRVENGELYILLGNRIKDIEELHE